MNNNSITNITDFQNYLEEIRSEGNIRWHVADEALSHEDVETFFLDLQNSGCVSWMISSLIYYHETHEFFDKHYDEIEDMRYEYEESIGEKLSIEWDLKNFLAWFAFEEAAYQIATEWNLV